jgi:hypothetical protein
VDDLLVHTLLVGDIWISAATNDQAQHRVTAGESNQSEINSYTILSCEPTKILSVLRQFLAFVAELQSLVADLSTKMTAKKGVMPWDWSADLSC